MHLYIKQGYGQGQALCLAGSQLAIQGNMPPPRLALAT